MELAWVIPVSGVITLIFVTFLSWDVLRRDRGTPQMQEVGQAIYQGAVTFITRQYSTIAILAIVTAVVVGFLVGVFERVSETGVVGVELGWKTGVAFLVGAGISALSGIIGMTVAVLSNQRVASAARNGVNCLLLTSRCGGAVSGFLVVGLSLIAVYAMFALYGGFENPEIAPFLIVGMGFGASLLPFLPS